MRFTGSVSGANAVRTSCNWPERNWSQTWYVPPGPAINARGERRDGPRAIARRFVGLLRDQQLQPS